METTLNRKEVLTITMDQEYLERLLLEHFQPWFLSKDITRGTFTQNENGWVFTAERVI